jgi:hypothetical protein
MHDHKHHDLHMRDGRHVDNIIDPLPNLLRKRFARQPRRFIFVPFHAIITIPIFDRQRKKGLLDRRIIHSGDLLCRGSSNSHQNNHRGFIVGQEIVAVKKGRDAIDTFQVTPD